MVFAVSFGIGFLIGVSAVMIYLVLKEDLRDGKK